MARWRHGHLRRQPRRRRARPQADRRQAVRPRQRLGRRAAGRRGAERVPREALLGGLRRVAPRTDRGRQRRDQGPARLRLRRLPPGAPQRPDRLRLPGLRSGGTSRWSSPRTTCCSGSTRSRGSARTSASRSVARPCRASSRSVASTTGQPCCAARSSSCCRPSRTSASPPRSSMMRDTTAVTGVAARAWSRWSSRSGSTVSTTWTYVAPASAAACSNRSTWAGVTMSWGSTTSRPVTQVGRDQRQGGGPHGLAGADEVVGPARHPGAQLVDVADQRAGVRSAWSRASVDLPTPDGPLRWRSVGTG